MATDSVIEFKKLLINEVKKYPQIWDNRDLSVRKDDAWSHIEQKFDLPLRRLRLLWSALRRHYFDILLMRTIERNSKACTWKLFHDMSFMYGNMIILIKEKMGGLSPPLLKPRESRRETCPCCLPVSTDNSDSTSSSEISLICPQMAPMELETITDETNNAEQAKNFSKSTSNLLQDESRNSLKRSHEMEDSSSHRSVPVKARSESYKMTKHRRAMEREHVIDAIRRYPVLYAKDSPGPKCSLSFAWKNVAEEVGIPLLTVQNRWRLFKRRYVEELMRQRCTNGDVFLSKWENFEQMHFMREHLKTDIENIDKIRQEIQQIVKEQKSRQTIDLSSDDIALNSVQHENNDNARPCNDQRIPDLKSAQCIGPALCDQLDLRKERVNKNCDIKEPAILTLDLISDEEDYGDGDDDIDDADDDEDVISLGDDDISMASDSSAEVYEEEVVFFAEPRKYDIICLDDDDENEGK